MKRRVSSPRWLRHWALQGAAVTLAGLGVEYGAQFARSIALTHRLDTTQFGIASAMAATLALIDMSTGLGADRYLIQAKDGGSQSALAAAHTLTMCRGMLSGALVALLAVPTARLLGIPDYAAAFASLAIIPVIRGFEHLGLSQMQRQHRFAGSALASSCANAMGLLGIVAVSAWARDYRAVPWGLGLQALTLVFGSHIGARSRYRLSVSRQALRGALRFGMPLMVNGLALAAMAQCDRLAAGHFLGVVALGHYTVAAMTFYLPTSLLLRLLVSVAQPPVSAAWHVSQSADFGRVYHRLNALVGAVAAAFATGIALFGNIVLTVLFGRPYAVGHIFLAIYAVFVFMRFAKTSVNFAGLAMGRTKDLMLSNLPGIGTLFLACVLLRSWPSFVVLALTSLFGEIIGTVFVCGRLRGALDIGLFAKIFLLALPLPVLSSVWVILADPSGRRRLEVAAGIIALLFLAVVVQRPSRTAGAWGARPGLASGRPE